MFYDMVFITINIIYSIKVIIFKSLKRDKSVVYIFEMKYPPRFRNKYAP